MSYGRTPTSEEEIFDDPNTEQGRKFLNYTQIEHDRCIRVWTIVGWICVVLLMVLAAFGAMGAFIILCNSDITSDVDKILDGMMQIQSALTAILRSLGQCNCPIPPI